jgi:hypothetical protein
VITTAAAAAAAAALGDGGGGVAAIFGRRRRAAAIVADACVPHRHRHLLPHRTVDRFFFVGEARLVTPLNFPPLKGPQNRHGYGSAAGRNC